MASSKKGAKGIEEHLTKYSLVYDPEKDKVRCKLTGHEMPARSDTILQYVSGKRYKLAAKRATDELVAKNAPHFSLDERNKQLFCALTGRHIVNDLAQLEMHLRGRRYLKELLKWQVAQTRGETYVPTWKRERNRRNRAMGRGADNDSDGEIHADMNDEYFEEFGDSDDEEGDEEDEEDEEGDEVEDGSLDEDEFDFAASSEEEAEDGKQKNGHSNPKANGSRKRSSAGSSNGVNSHTDDSHSGRARANGSGKKCRKTD